MNDLSLKPSYYTIGKHSTFGKLLQYIWKEKFLYIMVLPGIVFLITFSYIPMCGLLMGFENYSFSKGLFGSEWVGLRYFISFFTSPDAWKVIRNTLALNLYSLLICFPAPIIFALLLNEMRGTLYRKFIQTVSYLPYFLSSVVIAGMAVNFLSPSTGIINVILTKVFGIEPIYFIIQPEWFRAIYITIILWQCTGWGAIIYFAALSTLDQELYQSATVDGAGRFKKIWYITLPGILPTIIIMLLLNLGQFLNVSFELVLLLQNPGAIGQSLNLETSDVISTYVYRWGLQQQDYGYSTAVGLFQSLVGFVLIVSSNKLAKKLTETGLW